MCSSGAGEFSFCVNNEISLLTGTIECLNSEWRIRRRTDSRARLQLHSPSRAQACTLSFLTSQLVHHPHRVWEVCLCQESEISMLETTAKINKWNIFYPQQGIQVHILDTGICTERATERNNQIYKRPQKPRDLSNPKERNPFPSRLMLWDTTN